MTLILDSTRASTARSSGGPVDHAPAPGAPSLGAPSLAKVLQLVGSVVAPTTLVTALLFYFGWARTNAQAQRLGLDTSILGYSAQDYVLRSISSMYLPLAAGLCLALLGIRGHAAVTRWIHTDGLRPKLHVAAWAVGAVGMAAVTVGLLEVFVSAVRTNLLAPLCFTGGILVVAYAGYVSGRTTPGDSRAARPADPGWIRSSQVTLVGLLVALGLFWSVADYAGSVGRRLGDRILLGDAGLPTVVVFSPRMLHLDVEGVTETLLDVTEGAYRFRYDGLEFLERTGGRFFLRPSAMGPSGQVTIVIPESDAPQLQFVRGA